MTYRNTVQAAALAAAKFAWPGLPNGAVRWKEQPQKQQDPGTPNVVLSQVSHVPYGDVEVHHSELTDGNLQREFSQVWYWTVQVRVEGWRADINTQANPWMFVNRMRMGWEALAAQRALQDGAGPVRHPVKLVTSPGEIRDISGPISGHTLPQYLYELELSYVDYAIDPESDGVIEAAELHGHIGGTTDDDAVDITTDP